MKILHLPTNVASQISVTVRALRRLGIDARGLVWNNGPYGDPRDLELHKGVSLRRRPFRAVTARLRWHGELRRAVEWADVVHWYSGDRILPMDLDLRAIIAAGKPRVVEFWGTDVRDPRREAARNRYYAQMCEQTGELSTQNNRATATQRRFARTGFTALLAGPELRHHLRSEWFPTVYDTRGRVMLSDYEPAYPAVDVPEPLVVHAPSHRQRKGTEVVLRAVDRLKAKGRRFRFELIHGRRRDETLDMIGRCDVFLDQFVSGAHGLAAIEAMALGKPCVAYILPELRKAYPSELPIVGADQSNLADVLDHLLADGTVRHEAGRRGRAYVVRYHDALAVGRQLIEIYEGLLSNHSRCTISCRSGSA